MCLVDADIVRTGQTAGCRGHIANAAVAGLLMFVLLVATACSVSGALHQSLHPDSAANGHVCLICFFAKGHVSTAAVALFAVAVVFYCLGSLRLASAPARSRFDYRLSPSRAPPLS